MGSFYDNIYLLTSAEMVYPQFQADSLNNTALLGDSLFLDQSLLDSNTVTHLVNSDSTYTSYFSRNNYETAQTYEEEFGYLDLELAKYEEKYPGITLDDLMNTSKHYTLNPAESGDAVATTPVDFTKLSPKEIVALANNVDDVNRFQAIEHIKTAYVSSAPNVKLYYPEPFIASASFIHNDIGFIHILQYQFWLWFLFIFLIVFYFISFLCVVRWCSLRTQPRRETRGVSRSKCGDLITATVPVTWAISIIVSESTDATDYYDGFGTGELIIGVRAYQWGWHYYYPKNADLNYNVSPNYSTFVGNSLKYSTTTSEVFSHRSLWKFYQTKADDAVIVPAHLLVLPTDNSKILNVMSFKNVGIDTIQASRAFKQIRANSRTYTTNLINSPSYFTAKYSKINSLYFNDSDLVNTNNFGIKHQYNLTSAAANTAINSTFLDRKSMDKFLNYNLQYNKAAQGTKLYNNHADLWLKSNNSPTTNESLNATGLLNEGYNKYNSSTLKVLLTYPNTVKTFGDNSDTKATNYPLRKLLKKSTTKGNSSKLINKKAVVNSLNLKDSTSKVMNHFTYKYRNPSKTSKEFMVNYSYASQASSDQSVRTHKDLNANTTNYNLSLGLNSLDSNLNKASNNANYSSPYSSYQSHRSNFTDTTLFNKLASNRTSYKGIAPILTNNPALGRLDYDQMYTTQPKSYVNLETGIKKWGAQGGLTPTSSEELNKFLASPKSQNLEIQELNKKNTGKVQLLTGDRAGEDRTATASYWRMYWASTNPDLRLDSLMHAQNVREELYLPTFTNYYDYDFRNAQAIRLFEDVLWESAYSGYNHQDYLNIFNKYRETYDPRSLKWSVTNNLFFNMDRDFNQPLRFKTNAKVKDNSGIGQFYTNSIQTDDYYSPIYFTSHKSMANVPFTNDSLVMDESYADQKNLFTYYVGKNSAPLGVYNSHNFPQSHHAVLNNFRSDFEDFSHFQDLSTKFSKTSGGDQTLDFHKSDLKVTKFSNLQAPEHGKGFKSLNINNDVNPNQYNWSRFSNPITLRRSAKSSMVTYQAYQKVFKLRYDEGRAHVRLTDFAASSSAQPYTTEQRVKYDRMLGKTKVKHFNTIYNTNRTLPVFNDLAGLSNSLNYYFYEFPFLEGVTNDPTRHVWFDGYIKYAQREVGGSSVSKYTIVGVPFFKKKYDFNVKQGKQMADTELYFTRIATARKNYLPQWLYTPYLYTRSNEWFLEARTKSLHASKSNSLVNVRLNLKRMEWYWTKPFFDKTSSMRYTPSFSNNHKSVFRPYAGIQSYYYTLNTLTDLLSKREYLYRQTLEKRNKILELPRLLRVTPKNPLLVELKASFLLTDPITYNAEYSREFYYNSLSYFKFILFKEFILNLNTQVSQLPINFRLVNDYLFFHFFENSQNKEIGARAIFQKNQYKPLKKGISSMMRLQGSGAVAMPIEIRLQILASSRDVIHSWAIPSAGIKIDCIPGYTSHRIMIFFTPGIYWGQCMEICGRYHHWMPIIVYFMKRDLFFLWCTHFLSKKDPYAIKFWEANDKQYSDYINFISYNKSNWLTEVGHLL